MKFGKILVTYYAMEWFKSVFPISYNMDLFKIKPALTPNTTPKDDIGLERNNFPQGHLFDDNILKKFTFGRRQRIAIKNPTSCSKIEENSRSIDHDDSS